MSEAVKRQYLEVPYPERGAAKRLGAQWDPQARAWWVPSPAPAALYARWMPPAVGEGPLTTVRLLVIPEDCWKCSAQTSSIVGVLAGEDEESFVPFGEELARAIAAVVTPAELALLGIGELRPRWSRSGAAVMSNGCVRCGVVQGAAPLQDALAGHISDDGTYAELEVARVNLRLPG